MDKIENIHIKIEISKDPHTGHLNFITRFDPNAPNFTRGENDFSWSPTREERKFINEVFDLLQKEK